MISSASSIGPWNGKLSSSNVLKKTRLNKRSSGLILVLRLPSASRTQVALEEELGACIPTVFKVNIDFIFCDAVRIWRDHDNGVLHTPQPLSTRITM